MHRTHYLYAIYIFWPKRLILKTPEEPETGLKEESMTTWTEWAWRGRAANESDVPLRLRLAATVLRLAFIALLVVVTVRVSLPQNETIWTAYDTPGDLIRMLLGFGVCLWIAFQFFAAPRDAHSHRTWLYIGAAALPFAVICTIAIW
jgi:hypothetical protein